MEDLNKLKRIDYLTEEHELLNLPLIGWGRGNEKILSLDYPCINIIT